MAEKTKEAARADVVEFQKSIGELREEMGKMIVGNREVIDGVLTCMLAGSHALLEGVPGLGKTMLVRTMAEALELQFSRVQFTPDMMPADILGTTVIEESATGAKSFSFRKGPIFANIVLADEINRATPKTQSALLEAMEEHQVSVENETRPLPKPFFVIATQNPTDQLGTYPLPESQLDRFLMCITLGYPDRASERALLSGEDRRGVIERLGAVMSPAELVEAQGAVQRITVSDALLDYLQALIAATRSGQWFIEGLSPRAGISILRAARARALLARRDYVAPDDVQAILPQTAAHRLLPVASAGRGRVEQVRAMIEAIGLP